MNKHNKKQKARAYLMLLTILGTLLSTGVSAEMMRDTQTRKYLSAIPDQPVYWLTKLAPLFDCLLPAKAEAATSSYGSINLDGSIAEWTIDDRLNFPLDKPPTLATTGPELYARYVATPVPTYVFALKLSGTQLAANTTLWLNTDQNAATGFQVWGAYAGAEYSVNVFTDGIPYLYDVSGKSVGAMDYAYSADKTVLELAIPAASMNLAAAKDINVIGDINDTVFFPEFYSTAIQYTVPVQPPALPVRQDPSKRVGIVFSETSKNKFYNEKAYSQLYMAIQHQTMMAGIGFDLLTESDLTNLNKLVNYDALIFPYASNLPKNQYNAVRNTLYKAIHRYHIGIITADNFMTNDEFNAPVPGDSYQLMKQFFGITRTNGAGPVALSLFAGDINHPAMKGYASNEIILSSGNLNSYQNSYTSYFDAIPGQNVTVLANQSIPGIGFKPGAIATVTGGRNVHFATTSLMADSNLVWQALQWVVYGNDTPVALKMGRQNNLFVSRNDMDQSQEFGYESYDSMGNVDVPLYGLLKDWKARYNFVGSYYINIGNSPTTGQSTVWWSTPPANMPLPQWLSQLTSIRAQAPYDSGPLYQNYIYLGNEIGTHSYTHPADTNLLNSSQIAFEFNQSMNEIINNITLTGSQGTWKTQNIRGGAVPGMPENLNIAHDIMQHLDYLSGGGSLIGAGYPSAIGYLTPADNKVYFSPNMSFDFTLMDFGVPTGNPPVPMRLNATQAEQFWTIEYFRLMKHAAQPIIHWPWHDYGPTSATTPASQQNYTVEMFTSIISRAFGTGAEFLTAADAAQRINAFKNAKFTVNQTANTYSVNVVGGNLGTFALAMNLPAGQKIQRVNNWYAYSEDKVFIDEDGGDFTVVAGTVQDNVTHITQMPMRSRITSLTGDGTNLELNFEGEGRILVSASEAASNFNVTFVENTYGFTNYSAPAVIKSGNLFIIDIPTLGRYAMKIQKSTGTVLPGTVLPSGAVNCSGEGGTCTLPSGTRATVYYGANNQFASKTAQTGSIACNNDIFGDPAPNVVKACYYVQEAVTPTPPTSQPSTGPAGTTKCSDEGGTCTLPSGITATVYFGANNQFASKTGQTGSVACNNGIFGDPIGGVVKACYYVQEAVTPTTPTTLTTPTIPTGPAKTTYCSAENGTCTLPSGVKNATVYYGANKKFKSKAKVTNSIACNSTIFGDPIPNVAKACFYK